MVNVRLTGGTETVKPSLHEGEEHNILHSSHIEFTSAEVDKTSNVSKKGLCVQQSFLLGCPVGFDCSHFVFKKELFPGATSVIFKALQAIRHDCEQSLKTSERRGG